MYKFKTLFNDRDIKGVTQFYEKRVITYLILALSLTLAACSNTNDNNNQEHHSNAHAPKNAKTLKEKDIFSSNKKGQKLAKRDEASFRKIFTSE